MYTYIYGPVLAFIISTYGRYSFAAHFTFEGKTYVKQQLTPCNCVSKMRTGLQLGT